MRVLLIAAALFATAPAFAGPAGPVDDGGAGRRLGGIGQRQAGGGGGLGEGATCTAAGGTEQPATRACRRVVQKFGAVTEFSYKGTELSADELAACNA
ncbi:hypothetical protein [Brevundimonas sp.]|uniref:CC_3452 family protein n=1 Tax=Brevundimonas sp. TaxID=1871086 RepID=UPI0017C6F3AB|nr:hypothetical protein [Brevundimonas sp.]MBA4807467.1 hypothetical protein [Brevundimonas sp.]